MTMFHDTFCTPPTFDKLIHDKYTNTLDTSTNNNQDNNNNTNVNNNNSDDFASVSSNDESITSDQKLLVWIQRQLEFYITLSLLPTLSCIDDLGHGKLLLCLIHRFAPGSLPSLVTILEQKTSIECLLLADDFAQQLWNTAIDSLAMYLYHHYHSDDDDLPITDNTATIGDYVDQLIVPCVLTLPPSPVVMDCTSSTPLQHNSSSDINDEENHAQLPAAISADTLPIWQSLTNNNGVGDTTITTTTTSSSLTPRDWIATTHQSVNSYLQQPQTIRLSALISLSQQLQQVYVGFIRLTSIDAGDEHSQSIQQLLRQLEMIKEPITRLTTSPSQGDDPLYLVDILVQRHACLGSWVRSAFSIFQQSSRVQDWVTKQQVNMDQVKDRVNGGQVDGARNQFNAWLNSVVLYRQENTDVLALKEYYHHTTNDYIGTSRDWVAQVTLNTVIKTLDGLDNLLTSSEQVSRQIRWKKSLDDWNELFASSCICIGDMLDSVSGLTRHATSWADSELTCTTLWQQWKILSKRVADFSQGTHTFGYGAVLSLYHRLQLVSSSAMVDSVQGDYKVFCQKWQQLELAMERTRHAIALKNRVEDFVQQCKVLRIDTEQLVGQLGLNTPAQKSWMEQRVQDMDRRISQLLVMASSIVTDAIGDNSAVSGGFLHDLIQGWRDTLSGCKVSYHQALDGYRQMCAGLEQQHAVEGVKQQLSVQLDILGSCAFDPWTCCLGDQYRLEQDYSTYKRYYGDAVLLFDQYVKDGEMAAAASVIQDVRLMLEKGKQSLVDLEYRLDVLQKRIDWDQKWCLASTWLKSMSNNLHMVGIGNESGNSSRYGQKEVDGDLDDIQQQVLGYKPNIEQLQQAFGLLMDKTTGMDSTTSITAMSVSRIRQRQHLLDEDLIELYKLLDTTQSVLSQSKLVNEYMSWVDDINQATLSIGNRLDDGLRSEQIINSNDISNAIESVDQDIQDIELSAVQLWQKSGSQVLYPLSFLVVDDGVRWKVLNAYGNLLASLVKKTNYIDAWVKRSQWEQQWQHDMDTLKQQQQSISSWLQQHTTHDTNDDDFDINTTLEIIRDYAVDPLRQLQQLFTATLQQYPSNIKIPAVLEEQQHQLTVDKYGHLKSLSNLVNYLQTAKKLQLKCDAMNAKLDKQGDLASEEEIQQWIDETKVSVDQHLFGLLHEQLGHLLASDGDFTLDGFDQDKIQLVFDKAETTTANLHERLSTALKASHHNRLIRAHEDSAMTLTSLLQGMRDELVAATTEHGRMISGATPSDYQGHEQALDLKQQDTRHSLDTVQSVSYNDVRCLCQLIQLQQEEPEVASRQTQLDDLWQAVRQDTQDMHRLVLDLGQWRELSASLDEVETMLGPVQDHMVTVKTDLRARGVLLKIYQDAHTILATVNNMVPCGDDGSTSYGALTADHNKRVFAERSSELSKAVDGILTGLLHCTLEEARRQSGIISKRLDTVAGMDLFDNDGNILLSRQWDDLTAKMAESESQGTLVNSTMKSLKALCDETKVDLVNACQQSVDHLSSTVAMEQLCSRTLLANGLSCGRQAMAVLSWLDEFSKELDQFVHQASTGDGASNWRSDLRVWEFRVANYEKNELQDFFDKVQDSLVCIDQGMQESMEAVQALGQHVEQDIQSLVQQVESRWQKIQDQLAEGVLTVTQTQLGKLAEEQWHGLSTLVNESYGRTNSLVAGFYPPVNNGTDSSGNDDKDESMVQTMGQEQDLVLAEQSLIMLEHEMRPLIKSKAVELKSNLDGLAALSTGMTHADVDDLLNNWESKIQQHKRHLRHGITMCQYYAAAAEVHGYMYAMEQVIDKNNPELMVATRFMMVDGHAIAVELETKHKIYSGALDISMEKARQAALLVESSGPAEYAQLVAKRTKLEQRFNDRMKEWRQWIGSTSSSGSSSSSSSSTSTSPRLSGLRSRKISLPSKMPSPPMTASTATATVSSRRRVASSISSSSSPLLQAQRKNTGRKSSFTNATRPPPAPNSYVADPKNDLDMEIGRIVNKAPYKVELQMVPGEAGRYRFGDKVVYCRILKSHMVMVRVGGGWTELSQFLRDHALLVNQGSGFVMRKSSMESCQEAFLETKRATSPTSGRPLPRMSQSSSTSTVTSNAGYKDGDRYIAVDMQGQQHEMKMTPHDSNSSRRRS